MSGCSRPIISQGISKVEERMFYSDTSGKIADKFRPSKSHCNDRTNKIVVTLGNSCYALTINLQRRGPPGNQWGIRSFLSFHQRTVEEQDWRGRQGYRRRFTIWTKTYSFVTFFTFIYLMSRKKEYRVQEEKKIIYFQHLELLNSGKCKWKPRM